MIPFDKVNCADRYTQVISKGGFFSEADAQNLKQAELAWRRAPVIKGPKQRKAGGFSNLGGASREGFKFGDVSEAKMPSFESPWVYPLVVGTKIFKKNRGVVIFKQAQTFLDTQVISTVGCFGRETKTTGFESSWVCESEIYTPFA